MIVDGRQQKGMSMFSFSKVSSESGKTHVYSFSFNQLIVKGVAHLEPEGVTAHISTWMGCPFTCAFCNMGRIDAHPLSVAQIVLQVQCTETYCRSSLSEVRFDVSGDPMVDWPVIESAIEIISKEFLSEILLCTAGPRVKYYEDVLRLGKKLPKLRLQFSVHESNEERRLARFQQSSNLLSIDEIAGIGASWSKETCRPCEFNYAVTHENSTLADAKRLSEQLPPDVWKPQITPTYVDGNPPQAIGLHLLPVFSRYLSNAGYKPLIYAPLDGLKIKGVPGLD